MQQGLNLKDKAQIAHGSQQLMSKVSDDAVLTCPLPLSWSVAASQLKLFKHRGSAPKGLGSTPWILLDVCPGNAEIYNLYIAPVSRWVQKHTRVPEVWCELLFFLYYWSTLWRTLAIPIICCSFYAVLLCSLWWIAPHPCSAHVHAISKLLLCCSRQMLCNFPVVGHTYWHSQQALSSAHFWLPLPSRNDFTSSTFLIEFQTYNKCIKGLNWIFSD